MRSTRSPGCCKPSECLHLAECVLTRVARWRPQVRRVLMSSVSSLTSPERAAMQVDRPSQRVVRGVTKDVVDRRPGARAATTRRWWWSGPTRRTDPYHPRHLLPRT